MASPTSTRTPAPNAPTMCRCGAPTRNHAYVCDPCLDHAARHLGDTPWLATELDTTITRQRGNPTTGIGGANDALPWHEAASRTSRELDNLLRRWAAHADPLGLLELAGDHNVTPAALSRLLLRHLDHFALDPAGPDLVDQLHRVAYRAGRIIDNRPEAWYAGPCEICKRDLYAHTRRGTIACPDCGRTYDVEARRDWLLGEAEDRLANAVTVAQAVSWLGAQPLTPTRIRKWAERGRLVPRGHDGRSPLYRVGDAIDLLAADTRRAS